MENNTSTYYQDATEHSRKPITYEFKSELLISNNDSMLNKESLSQNSSLTKENLNNNLDNMILKLLSECQDKYQELFFNTIMNECIEDGYISDSQRLYKIIKNEYGDFISSLFLSKIYTYYANDKVIKSILYIMAKLNPKNLNGIEEGIIAFALNNKDYEVRDLALQCFEKWNDIKYLNLLKSLKMDVDFLQEYLECIINTLEIKRDEKNVY